MHLVGGLLLISVLRVVLIEPRFLRLMTFSDVAHFKMSS